MKKSIIFKLAVFLFTCSLTVFGQGRLSSNESNFYVSNIGSGRKTLALTGNNSGVDSQTLNREITRMSNNGGGIITINKVPNKPYIYLRSIILKSKIQLKIAENVTIRPWYGGNPPRNIVIFGLGADNNRISNVAITNKKEWSNNPNDFFTINIHGGVTKRVQGINTVSVSNFKISGIKFIDSYTVFSNIECNLSRSQSRRFGDIPSNGLIKNVVSFKNHVGYGIIQIRAGRNILFKNLDGEGGVTLRIESGIIPAIRTKNATILNVVGRNITVRKGDAAVMLAPHRIDQGRVDVSDIKAFSSTVAVQIDGGFLDRKGGVDNLGSFNAKSFIGDIKKVQGGSNSQVKSKDVPLYPCSSQTLISGRPQNQDNESTRGPSLAVVRYGAHPRNNGQSVFGTLSGPYEVVLRLPSNDKISGLAYGVNRKVVYPGLSNHKPNCNTSKVSKSSKLKEDFKIKVYPNPTSDLLNIISEKDAIINIYSNSGQLVISKINTSGNKTIDIANLVSGFYFVEIISKDSTITKKIIIE